MSYLHIPFMKSGLKALLRNHSKLINAKNVLCESGDLDKYYNQYPLHQQASRWDYIVIKLTKQRESAYYVEHHPATSHGVEEMRKKIEWVQMMLNTDEYCKQLKKIPSLFIWLCPYNSILPNSNYSRQAARLGLKPMKTLDITK